MIKAIYKFLIMNEYSRAVFIIILFLIIFFIPGIFLNKIYSAADVLQRFPTFKIEKSCSIQNGLLTDQMCQMVPWFGFSRESLKNGSFPLWNPYQGNGTPHIANMQSGTFYPLSWIVFVFGFKNGLGALYFFKLFFIGYFMYLYLREINVHQNAAIVASIAFMFCGYNIAWLYYPLTRVVFFLPLSFLLIDKIINSNKNQYYYFYSFAIGIALFGGNPEPIAHMTLASFSYFLFRLFLKNISKKAKACIFAKYVLSSFVGVLFASVQLLPFFEYLFNSRVYYMRGPMNAAYLKKTFIALNFIPDLFGNWVKIMPFPLDNIFPKRLFIGTKIMPYNDCIAGYVGLTVLVLAILSFANNYKNRIIIYFFILSIFCIAVTYKFPLVFKLFTRMPIFNKVLNTRLLLIHAFSMCVLSALFLSQLIRKNTSLKAKKNRYIVVISIILIFALAAIAIYKGLTYIVDHISYKKYAQKILVLYLIDICILCLIVYVIKNPRILAVCLLLLVFAETGIRGKQYEPTIKSEYFYPQTNLIKFLKNNIGINRVISISEVAYFGPNMGTFYNLCDVRNYDAMLLNNYFKTFSAHTDVSTNWQNINFIDKDYLNRIGVKYIIAQNEKEFSQKLLISNKELGKYPVVFKGVGYKVFYNSQVWPRAFCVKDIYSIHVEEMGAIEYSQEIPIFKHYSPNRVVLEVENKARGYLILTDTYFPGWKVYVNGIRKNILETSMSFRGVPVEKGKNIVEFYYFPETFKYGLIISIIVALSIIAGVTISISRKSENE